VRREVDLRAAEQRHVLQNERERHDEVLGENECERVQGSQRRAGVCRRPPELL
jgi:hypothetical protein